MPPFRFFHRLALKTALTTSVTGLVLVLRTIMTPVMCPKVRVSVSIIQENTPEDLHLTLEERGAEKDCYRGCYELYNG